MKINKRWITSTLISVLILNQLTPCALASEEQGIKKTKHHVSVKKAKNEAESLTKLTPIEKYTQWKEVTFNKNLDGGKISVMLDGQRVFFDNGIVAHANSKVIFDINKYSDIYDRFLTYAGIEASQGTNGELKIIVSVSNDKKNWTTLKDTGTIKGGQNAIKIDVNIKGYKYLKLEADSLGSNGHDHAVYANPVLCTPAYNDELVSQCPQLKNLPSYDVEIQKKYTKAKKLTTEIQKLVWQRTFVQRFGFYNIKNLVESNTQAKKAINSILENKNNTLSYFIQGGTLDKGGNPVQSLNEWVSLYTKFHRDFTNSVYLKLAVATAITHGNNIRFWTGRNPYSKAVDRYAVIKKIYDDGRMAKGIRTKDIKEFEKLPVDLMRWITNNQLDNREINWFADYALKQKEEKKNYLDAYNYITYRTGYNYSKPELHDINKAEKYNKKYHFKEIYSSKEQYEDIYNQHLWQVFEEGSVCGGLAKTYANVNEVFGTPASVTGQPGHAATFVYDKKDGKIIWVIQNDISGFAESEKGERLPLGWGTNYEHSHYNGLYLLLSAEALNHPEKFNVSNDYVLLAQCLKASEEKINAYQKALKELNINLDAIEGLISELSVIKADDKEYLALANYVASVYQYHPLALHDVLKTIRKHMDSENNQIAIDNLRYKTLKKASEVTSKEFIQPNECRQVAKSLMGEEDTQLATFSFNGKDAGKIIINKKYDNSAIRWEYSLDGWKTKKETDKKSIQLTPEELEKINEKDGIEISLVGTDAKYKIDITKGILKDSIYQNDWENRFTNCKEKLEYRIDSKGEWKPYTDTTRFDGNETVEVRTMAQKTQLASDSKIYHFTNQNTVTQKYIPLNQISLYKYSSQQDNNAAKAENMLDGNPETMWHNTWNGENKRYYSVKFTHPVELSRIDYLPRKEGSNGRLKEVVIYVSDNGKDWKEVQTFKDIKDNSDWKSFVLDKPVKATYVAIDGKQTYPNNQFFSGRMLNFYEDATQQIEVGKKEIQKLAFLSKEEQKRYEDELIAVTDMNQWIEKATVQNKENEKQEKEEAMQKIKKLGLKNEMEYIQKVQKATSLEQIQKIIDEAQKDIQQKEPIKTKDARYVAIVKKDIPIYKDLELKKKKGTTNSIYQQTLKTKVYYTFEDGSVYVSLYNKDDKWLGYVNDKALEYTKTAGGKHYSVKKYAAVLKKDQPLWQDLEFKKKKDTTKSLYKKTVYVKGEYHHFNGSTYASLYNKDDKWLGYVNDKALEYTKTAGGKYYSVKKDATVLKKDQTLWQDLELKKKKGTTKSLYKKIVYVKGEYHHFNGSTYASLYNKNNKWLGYVNNKALKY